MERINTFKCDVCGKEFLREKMDHEREFFYENLYGQIVGCTSCISPVYATDRCIYCGQEIYSFEQRNRSKDGYDVWCNSCVDRNNPQNYTEVLYERRGKGIRKATSRRGEIAEENIQLNYNTDSVRNQEG